MLGKISGNTKIKARSPAQLIDTHTDCQDIMFSVDDLDFDMLYRHWDAAHETGD